jgi:hypothetical protein
MVIECLNCTARVDATEVFHYDCVDEEAQMAGRYTLYKCTICGSPFLFLSTDDDEYQSFAKLYPPPDVGISFAIPKSIRSCYLEAQACYRVKAYTATAIMCRKVLEAIAEEHGVKGRGLAMELKELRDKGFIENRLFEWADTLRMSGNEAAHGIGTTTTGQDALDILEFTNALLEYVFTFRDKFKQWKKRRESAPPREPEF